MRAIGIVLMLLFGMPIAHAETPGPDAAALHLRSLAATCAQCHGTDGHAPPGSAITGLAGKPAGYLVEQMTAFKRDVRPGILMPQIAKGFSDAQIAQLAVYFAQVTPKDSR